MPTDVVEQFQRRDRRALARLLSQAARGEAGQELLAQLGPPVQSSRVIALTGSAGVGKSSLVGRLIEVLRKNGRSVAVLACDPESPITGGALLGDRMRMPNEPDDAVFIRSLAAAGGQGAVAAHLDEQVRLLERFGFDVILIETVGAGQGDTRVREAADVVVVLLQPETGDDVQWEKAGILEIADLVVIQKADLPGADRIETQVRLALGLLNPAPPQVLRVSARTGAGVEALWEALSRFPLKRSAEAAEQRELLQRAQDELARWFREAIRNPSAELRALLAEWKSGSRSAEETARALLRLAGSEGPARGTHPA